MADRHSALHEWYTPGLYGADASLGLHVRQRRDLNLYQLTHWPDRGKAFADMLGELIGLVPTDRASGNEGHTLLPIGPETYWLVSADVVDGSLRDRLEADIGTLADLGHACTGLSLSGPKSRALLAKGLPIDLHPRAFPEHGVAVSAIHGIDIVVHRNGTDSVFDLYVPRSYAGDFWHWLTGAAAEFGYRVD